MIRRLSTHLLILSSTVAAYLARTEQQRRALHDDRDRGDALGTAVIAVGLVAIAIVVIAILRNRATEIARNICTSTDQAECRP
ncbi:hypothetical protein [Parafrankia sp. EUN1f]|uniref:hypothetical protein n=1 Tax=Parafrankia sp. EUN1f TaxID=102897 RepID=UPI0001C45FE7|nr:hypothetical protein [Parafrankia sp. EUN1f]EFC81315.1 hypothetical protein FrEUN1fDRAFT_5562 [Parafrankia sp. EUN1f]